MPYPSRSPALRSVAAPASGTVGTDRFGLTIVPLGLRGSAPRPPPPPLFTELDPPHPGSLAAFNPSQRAVELNIGDTVVGGMSDRGVVRSLALPPGASVVVAVEPLSARWWQALPPQAAAPLPPALTALLILATHAGPGLRSIARTALWEGWRQHGAMDEIRGPYGWLVLRGHAVLATHLVRWRAPRRRSTQPPIGSHATSLVRLLPEGEAGASVIRLTHAHERRIEVWLVRASPGLPDAVVQG